MFKIQKLSDLERQILHVFAHKKNPIKERKRDMKVEGGYLRRGKRPAKGQRDVYGPSICISIWNLFCTNNMH
jgi:hypothetical protein